MQKSEKSWYFFFSYPNMFFLKKKKKKRVNIFSFSNPLLTGLKFANKRGKKLDPNQKEKRVMTNWVAKAEINELTGF